MKAAVFGSTGGIGSALVDAIAARPDFDTIYALAREPQPVQGRIVPVPFDLAEEQAVAEAVAAMEPVDLAVVATGALTLPGGAAPEKSWRQLDPAAMAEAFRVNAIGPALIAKHLLPRLPRDRRSVFAVLSARVGSIGDNRLGGWHSYRAAKAALNMLVRNFAIELGRTHRHAICIALHPGTVDTGLAAPFLRAVPDGQLTAPAVAANRLLRVLDGLQPADSGGLFAWDGEPIPY